MDQENEIIPNKEKTSLQHKALMCVFGLFSLLYLICLPRTLALIPMSLMMFDSSRMTMPIWFFSMLILTCLPASIILSLIKIWSNHSQKKHRRAAFFCILPILTLIAVYLISTLWYSLILQ